MSRRARQRPASFKTVVQKAKRRPKDCFNNFYFSFGSEDMVKRIGSSRLMIGSDFPHPDGMSPILSRC